MISVPIVSVSAFAWERQVLEERQFDWRKDCLVD